MGVDRYLKLVAGQYLTAQSRISDLTKRGKTRAVVDSSGWIHKALRSCAIELFEGDRQAVKEKVLGYFRRSLAVLKSEGVLHVHFVFDGAKPRMRATTDKKRTKTRESASQEATELQQHKSMDKSTRDLYTNKCIEAISRPTWLTTDLCVFLKKNTKKNMELSFEVALYEADAQMAHLLRINAFDFVITEDQDLALFGAQLIVYKLHYWRTKYKAYECDILDLTNWTGPMEHCNLDSCSFCDARRKAICPVCTSAVLDNDAAVACDSCHQWKHIHCANVSRASYRQLMNSESKHWFCSPICQSSGPSSQENDSRHNICELAHGLTQSQVRQAYILAGTDYSDGIRGVAIGKAFPLIRKNGTLTSALSAKKVDPNLRQNLLRAEYTFLYHIVRTPGSDATVSVTHLNPPPPGMDLLGPEEYLGDINMSLDIHRR